MFCVPTTRGQGAPALRGFIIENELENTLMPYLDWAEIHAREALLFLFVTAGLMCMYAHVMHVHHAVCVDARA
jgi:hypothetical protein